MFVPNNHSVGNNIVSSDGQLCVFLHVSSLILRWLYHNHINDEKCMSSYHYFNDL